MNKSGKILLQLTPEQREKLYELMRYRNRKRYYTNDEQGIFDVLIREAWDKLPQITKTTD